MKHLLTLFILYLCTLIANAQQRTIEQAQQIAADFMSTTADALTPVTAVNQAKSRTEGDQPAFYVFNHNRQPGYVIVSGNEQFKPILGYNETETFNPDSLPDGLSYWLQFLKEETLSALSGTSPIMGRKPSGWSPLPITGEGLGERVFSPLLTSYWSQGKPFNSQIPVSYTGDASTYDGHASVGCVATALGEIMSYWRYPAQGQGGTHTNARYTSATVNFSEQTYNWYNIKNNYGYYLNEYGRTMYASFDETEAYEVAKLCYHIGVAVDMAWNTDGKGTSAATDGKALRALTQYFGYNKYAYLQERRTLSLGAFQTLLLQELQAGRPVPYSGSSSETGQSIGHYFVLDGYDAATGLFHFNWGWSGVHNGYYAISALEPGTGGTGAGAGSYNYNQNVLIGVQPTEEYFEYAPAYSATRFTVETPSFERGGGYNNCARIKAYGLACHDASFSGTFGLALYNSNGTYETGKFTPLSDFRDGTSFEYIIFDTPPFNKLIPFGTHTLRLVARSDDGTLYPIHATFGQPDSWQVVVTQGATNRDPGTVTVTALPPSPDPYAGIQGVIADVPTPVRTEYYTLSGIRLQTPRPGLIIQNNIFSDGTVKTKKILYK